MKPGGISPSDAIEAGVAPPRAIEENGWVFVAGTVGIDFETMALPVDAAAQCDQAFRNIEAALRKVGAAVSQVARVTYVVPDPEDWDVCWPVAHQWLGRAMPSASVVTAHLRDPRVKIEIEVTARLPD